VNFEKKRKQSSVASTTPVNKRSTRKNSRDDDNVTVSRSRRTAASESAKVLPASRPVVAPTPAEVSAPTHQNLGDKVVRALLYPFRHRGEQASTPAAARSAVAPSNGISPTPSPKRRPNN
jgi:hypothetical protein